MVSLTILGAGLVLLIVGSGWLVSSGIVIAKRLGLAPLIIGMTVVAWGTSMPEMFVAVQAALGGSSPLGLGVAIGSNIANIGLIFAVTFLLSYKTLYEGTTGRFGGARTVGVKAFFLGSPILLLALLLLRGRGLSDPLIALCLLGSFGLYNAYMWKTGREPDPETESAEEGHMPLWTAVLLALVVSPLALYFGSKWLVLGATELAKAWGVQDSVIGVSAVAIGTSLPELFTGIQAYRKGKAWIGVGNLVGSNVFNILAVVGVTGLLGGYPDGQIDMVVYRYLPITIALTIFATYRPKSQKGVFHQGWFLLLCYIGFLGWLLVDFLPGGGF